MVITIEQDMRKHETNGWAWKPGKFKAQFNGGTTRRYWWGWWSLSLYPCPGLREHHDYIASGATEWRSE